MLPSELDCPPMTKQGSRDGEFRDAANLRHRAKHLRYHAKDEQRFVVSVIAYDFLPGHQPIFLKHCAAYPFGRDSGTFEKPGHHSRLLLLSLDDIYWQGNADSRRLASDLRL
jgi:hypothetical protein